jgi:hypothetical protein
VIFNNVTLGPGDYDIITSGGYPGAYWTVEGYGNYTQQELVKRNSRIIAAYKDGPGWQQM